MLWLIGCTGMLGREFAYHLSKEGIPFVGTGSDVDIADIEKLEALPRSQKTAGGRFSRMLYAKQNNALHMLTIQPFIAPVQYFCYDEV